MIERIFSALFLLLISSTFVAANAADTTNTHQGPVWVDPGWRRTVSRYTVTFDEQGLSTTVLDFEIQALDEKGAQAISQQSFTYNSYFDELAVDDLATLKADGSVIAVDERAIRDQPASADTSSPYFDERRNRIIAFPFVTPGDKIRGHLIHKAKRPDFAGEFARYWSQPADQPPELIELTIDGPASKPLHVAGRNVEHSEERLGNRIVHHVRLRQETPRLRQMDIDSFDDARRFEASTFADYAAFAAMLNARNAPMAQPDATLRKLSTEIVGDAGDVSAKVERIHNWVARNIRYVGIGFEDGGLTSQPASAVLASRYGDCKAHATILKALLAAQGIEANLVAVNADAQYTLTEVATPNFNHAIVYVPEIDQYLDPTAPLLAFGSLPPSLNGKPVLNIDKGILASIPVAKPDRFALAADTDYTLADDGTRRARSILSGSGLGATAGARGGSGHRKGGSAGHCQEADRVGRPARYRRLQLSKSARAVRQLRDHRHISDQRACRPRQQAERVRMLPLTDVRPSLAALTAGGANGQPFPCRSMEYRETSSLTLPEGTSFYEKPAPVTYAAKLQRQDGLWARERPHRSQRNGCARWPDLAFQRPCPADLRRRGLPGGIRRSDQDRLGQIHRIQIRADRPDTGSVPDIAEISAEYSEGVNAFLTQNYKLAMVRLKPFAEIGNAKAQSYVGSMYEAGRGVERNRSEAISWFLKAAGQGDAYSQSHLGYAYEKGLGVARDEKLAAQWYAKAADQGDAYSEARLASLYRDGRGVAQDFEQAAKWFAKAADQGSTWAQMNLGLLYVKGQGVPLDYTKAMSWLRNAADRNDSYAQYNLGWAYESGEGVPKDTQEAIKWYGKASNGGNQQASARLAG